MGETYREIQVTCPVCSTVKNVGIPEKLFIQKRFNIIKVQIPQGGVCREHHFIVFVDDQGIIRGYDQIDLLMKSTVEKEQVAKRFSLQHLINMFGLYGVICLIHAKIFDYPVHIIKDKSSEDLSSAINRIGDELLPETYRGSSNVQFFDEIDYNKINEKNTFLMDSNQHILHTPWQEKLKFEEEIIKKALEILDGDEQMNLIQQNIARFIREAEYVSKVLEKENEILEEDLIEKMARELMISKPNRYRINLIKEFIKKRYSANLVLKIKNKIEDFLSLL